MTTTTQRPQHAKPRRVPKITNPVYLRCPDSGRVLTLNANEEQFIRELVMNGYVKQGKPTHE